MANFSQEQRAELEHSIQEKIALRVQYRHMRSLSKYPKERASLDDEIQDLTELINKEQMELDELKDNEVKTEQGSLKHEVKAQDFPDVTESELTETGMSKSKTCQIFLSYAQDDLKSAREIYALLTRNSFSVWMNEKGILAGQDWRLETEKAIQACSIFIACLSRKSVSAQDNAQKELRLAYDVLDTLPEDKVFLIPVRLDDCEVPSRLNRIQRLDFFKPDGQEKLIEAIAIHIHQQMLKPYAENFLSYKNYLAEFERKINQAASNLGILITAQQKFASMLESLSDLAKEDAIAAYPSSDLRRISGLTGIIHTKIKSAAGLVANESNPTQQLNQISQNLPLLKDLVGQLSAWLNQQINNSSRRK